jgi:hypothetical protein
MAQELGWDIARAIRAVNASTCNGSQHLEGAVAGVAIVAAFSATNGKAKELQQSIVVKTVRQYVAAKKLSTDESRVISICSKYANGGVPEEFSFEKLKSKFLDRNTQPANPLVTYTDKTNVEFVECYGIALKDGSAVFTPAKEAATMLKEYCEAYSAGDKSIRSFVGKALNPHAFMIAGKKFKVPKTTAELKEDMESLKGLSADEFFEKYHVAKSEIAMNTVAAYHDLLLECSAMTVEAPRR